MGSWLRDRARDGGSVSPSHGRSLQDVSRSLKKTGKVFGHATSCAIPDSRFNHFLRAHTPKVVHGLRCSFLVNKHVFPVHHREGIEHRAQGLDGCRKHGVRRLASSNLSFPPALSGQPHTPRDPHAGSHLEARMDSDHGSPHNITGEMAWYKLHRGC